jgi:UDP-GlcNAc3NAcA epimerase
MYLTVNHFKEKALEADFIAQFWLKEWEFYFATIHRPSNTDNKEQLENIIKLFDQLNKKVVFSIHPRTKHKLEEFQIALPNNIIFFRPSRIYRNIALYG